MKKVFVVIFMSLIICVCFLSEANASTLSFRNFIAVKGAVVSVSYRVNAGTRLDPDSVTLAVDLSVPVVEFQLTIVGSGFPGGSWCELEWENESPGAPREDNVPLVDGGFSVVQNFSLISAHLNLTDGAMRSVLYELEADEEPYLSLLDTKRCLRVTFVASGSALHPANPIGSEVVKAELVVHRAFL